MVIQLGLGRLLLEIEGYRVAGAVEEVRALNRWRRRGAGIGVVGVIFVEPVIRRWRWISRRRHR